MLFETVPGVIIIINRNRFIDPCDGRTKYRVHEIFVFKINTTFIVHYIYTYNILLFTVENNDYEYNMYAL